MIDYRLYLVTDDPSRYRGNWLDNVAAAVAGGVTCVQYRDTESDAKARFERSRKLKEMLDARRVPLVINNEADLAAQLGAAGVHVGQSDMAPQLVRAIVGRDCEIGLSITDLAQVAAPSAACADCFGIGPVYDATKTKADAARALGVDAAREIVRRLGGRATVAIGGITPENARATLATGVGGLAVVSAFSQSADPEKVACAFLAAFGRDN